MNNDFLNSSKKLFQYYKSLGDKTFAQLKEEDFFWTPDEKSNCIAVIVQHLWGNMQSRWTNFLTDDGEKTWRDREKEFELYISTRKEVMEKWEEGWATLFHALSTVNEESFDTTIYIRSKGHSVTEAIQRQLGHYAYHVGQICYIGRQRALHWESLSIPKGKSKEYNKISFDKGKRREHFSDEFVSHTPKESA